MIFMSVRKNQVLAGVKNNLMETEMNLDDLTLGQIKEIGILLNLPKEAGNPDNATNHPMLGRRCLIRTYSAGVHIGYVAWINPQNSMEVKLSNSLRLWKWQGGGLSLSAIANNGVKQGRLNRTGEVFLTNVIEFIPTTSEAEKSYDQFIED